MKKNIFFASIAIVAVLASCNSGNKWRIKGTIENAPDKSMYVQASENGRWFTIDTIKTNSKGDFSYAHEAAGYPDIYRLTLDNQSIYFPIDSIETVRIESNANAFAKDYEISGSDAADMLMAVENRIKEVTAKQGDAAVNDSILKRELGGMLIGDPAGIVSYYIINKQINGKPLFNPANSADNRVIGAVANAFNQFRPNDPRTRYLCSLYLSNRPAAQKMSVPTDTIHPQEVTFFDINLTDNTGANHSLSDIVKRNKVVVLSFTVYQAEGSPAYNLALAEAYDKYHSKGLEIYQVALDEDEFQWKQSAKNLPWVTVYQPQTGNSQILLNYNVRQLPTTYIIANGELKQRVTDISKVGNAVSAYI
jgi:hypothetical protein